MNVLHKRNFRCTQNVIRFLERFGDYKIPATPAFHRSLNRSTTMAKITTNTTKQRAPKMEAWKSKILKERLRNCTNLQEAVLTELSKGLSLSPTRIESWFKKHKAHKERHLQKRSDNAIPVKSPEPVKSFPVQSPEPEPTVPIKSESLKSPEPSLTPELELPSHERTPELEFALLEENFDVKFKLPPEPPTLSVQELEAIFSPPPTVMWGTFSVQQAIDMLSQLDPDCSMSLGIVCEPSDHLMYKTMNLPSSSQ